MENILDEIFDALYSPLPTDTERWKALRAELIPMQSQIQETFGLEFLDRLNDLDAELETEERRAVFHRGFRVGARLMLSALTPA